VGRGSVPGTNGDQHSQYYIRISITILFYYY
jgi:hypothetical protein